MSFPLQKETVRVGEESSPSIQFCMENKVWNNERRKKDAI